MQLQQMTARNLDEPARILGLSPLELTSAALVYAILSPMTRGLPYSELLTFLMSLTLAATLVIFNRNYPAYHGLFLCLHLMRSPVVNVMPFSDEESR